MGWESFARVLAAYVLFIALAAFVIGYGVAKWW
jgi:hypothetical protein